MRVRWNDSQVRTLAPTQKLSLSLGGAGNHLNEPTKDARNAEQSDSDLSGGNGSNLERPYSFVIQAKSAHLLLCSIVPT